MYLLGAIVCCSVPVTFPIAVTETYCQKQIKRERSTFWLTVPRYSQHYGEEVEAARRLKWLVTLYPHAGSRELWLLTFFHVVHDPCPYNDATHEI